MRLTLKIALGTCLGIALAFGGYEVIRGAENFHVVTDWMVGYTKAEQNLYKQELEVNRQWVTNTTPVSDIIQSEREENNALWMSKITAEKLNVACGKPARDLTSKVIPGWAYHYVHYYGSDHRLVWCFEIEISGSREPDVLLSTRVTSPLPPLQGFRRMALILGSV
jgi:hypothetical protein